MSVDPEQHPSDEALGSYGLGKLDDDAAGMVAAHLEACQTCRRRVAEASPDTFLNRVRGADPASARSATGSYSLPETRAQKPAGPPPTDTLPPGLADHPDYEIKRELGRGGMGVVYLAHNLLMGRDEVLKVMGRQIMERPGVLDRFLREIRAVAKLRHPNIVAAYSASRLGDGIVFAMEYIEGLDLAKMVKSKGPMPVAHACHFAHQAALGLQHAFDMGLVHRDIKPANLMLSRTGNKAAVKVLDFGLAKATREEKVDGGLTSAGQALGTPDFIAPEQIMDAKSADIRADIYSLGATLYFLLTGRPPFRGESLYDIYQGHISRDAEPLNVVRPEVPSDLAALVAKMMAKEPGRRFQTPVEVAQALGPFFKRANAAFKVPIADVSMAREPSIPRPTAGGVSTPTQLDPTSWDSAPRVLAEGLTTVAEPRWESLLGYRDEETRSGAVAGLKPGRRYPRPEWPIVIAGALSALLAAGIIITIRGEDGRKTRINLPDDSTVIDEHSKADGRIKPSGPVRPVGRGKTIAAIVSELPNKPSEAARPVERSGIPPAGTSERGTADLPSTSPGLAAADVRPPPLPTAAIDRFRPGAVWVGSETFEGPTIDSQEDLMVMTILERSGDNLVIAVKTIDPGGKEMEARWTATIRGPKFFSQFIHQYGGRSTFEGAVVGRELRVKHEWKYKNKYKELSYSGNATLVYQGPRERRSPPEPPPVGGGANTAEEGSDRLALIGHWAHRGRGSPKDLELVADGTARVETGRGIWCLEGDRLTIRWGGSKPPGRGWRDELVLAADRKSFSGFDSTGVPEGATRVRDGDNGDLPKVDYGPSGPTRAGQ